MQTELTLLNNVIPQMWDLTGLFWSWKKKRKKKSPFALKKLPNANLLPLKSCNQELRVLRWFQSTTDQWFIELWCSPHSRLTPSSERGCSDQPRHSLHPWVSRQSHTRVGVRGDIMQITWAEDGGTADWGNKECNGFWLVNGEGLWEQSE